MESLTEGGHATHNIDREGKRHCEYEHDSFIVTKAKPNNVTRDIMWRFSSDRESGLALCSVGDIIDLNVAEEAQRCGLGKNFISFVWLTQI